MIEKFGVAPGSIPDWLALVGDSADGIPGLPGWGAKSAAGILAKFPRLEDIPPDAAAWKAPVRNAGALAAPTRATAATPEVAGAHRGRGEGLRVVRGAAHADVHRRASLEEQLLEGALLAGVLLDERVRQRRLEVDDRAWRAEIGAGHRVDRLIAVERVDAVFTFVIGDERDLGGALLVLQDDRRDVRGQRVGVLPQLAGLQAQRPDVVDVAVARDLGLDRLVRVGGGGRKDQRVLVEELRAAARALRDTATQYGLTDDTEGARFGTAQV